MEIVRVSHGSGERKGETFSNSFRIGRAEDCEVSIKNDFVSRIHAEVVYENGNWYIRDLNSSNGLYLDGQRVKEVLISGPLRVRLGVEGPEIAFDPATDDLVRKKPPSPDVPAASPSVAARDPGSGTVLRKYVDHYFSDAANSAPAGEHTMYVRRAFAAVQKKQKRNYGLVVTLMLLLAVGAGSYAFYE